jgi:hypothetical protein
MPPRQMKSVMKQAKQDQSGQNRDLVIARVSKQSAQLSRLKSNTRHISTFCFLIMISRAKHRNHDKFNTF